MDKRPVMMLGPEKPQARHPGIHNTYQKPRPKQHTYQRPVPKRQQLQRNNRCQWQPPDLQRTPPKLSQPVGWPFPSQGEHGSRYNAGVLDALNGSRAPRTWKLREEMDVELDNYLSSPYLGRAEARNNHIKLLPAKLEVQVLEVDSGLQALYLATSSILAKYAAPGETTHLLWLVPLAP